MNRPDRFPVAPLLLATLALLAVAARPCPAAALTLQWARIYNGPADGPDYGLDVAPTPGGAVYVAGTRSTLRTGSPSALCLRKHDAEGNLLWMRTMGNCPSDTSPGVVALPDGGAVISGAIDGPTPGTRQYFVRRLGPGGGTIWTYLGIAKDAAEGSDVALGPDGYLYVAGYSWANLLLRKHDPAGGGVVWERSLAVASASRGLGIASHPTGIYVSGWADRGTRGLDVLVVKYSAGGVRQWVKTWDHAARNDFGNAVIVGGDGNLYLAGSAGTGDYRRVFLERRTTGTGDRVWVRFWNQPSATFKDSASGLAELGTQLVVVGESARQGLDAAIWRYGRAGNLLGVDYWSRTSNNGLNAVAARGGQLYACGSSVTYDRGYDMALLHYH